jgi:hypothetical protein
LLRCTSFAENFLFYQHASEWCYRYRYPEQRSLKKLALTQGTLKNSSFSRTLDPLLLQVLFYHERLIFVFSNGAAIAVHVGRYRCPAAYNICQHHALQRQFLYHSAKQTF